ncbi:MFS transporter [Streptosporangium saharense]|uniref:MFS transporter n=1 Tax=Streptosporangium saharense TaxID=1706840 RepID=UPI0034364FD0
MKVSSGRFTAKRNRMPRSVQVLAPAIGLSNFGDGLAITALLLDLHDRKVGGAAIAAVFLAMSVPNVVLVGLAGRVADRLAIRGVLLSAGTALIFVCVTMAYVEQTVLVIALLAMLAGIMALAVPATMKAVADASPADLLSRAQARMAMMGSMGFLLGPAAGGVLMEALGLRTVLLVDAVTFLALPLAALFLPGRTDKVGAAPTSGPGGNLPRSGLLPGLRAIAAFPVLMRVIGLGVVLTIGLQVTNVVEIFFIRDDLGGGAVAFGVLTMAWSFGQIVGAWAAGNFLAKRSPAPTAFLSTFVMAVLTISVVAIDDLWVLFVLLILNGLAYGGFGVARQTLLAKSISTEVRGSAFAAHVALLNVATTAALLLGGAGLTLIAPRTVFGIVGAITLLSVLTIQPWKWSLPGGANGLLKPGVEVGRTPGLDDDDVQEGR